MVRTTSRYGKDPKVHCLKVDCTPGFQDSVRHEQVQEVAMGGTSAAGSMSSVVLHESGAASKGSKPKCLEC